MTMTLKETLKQLEALGTEKMRAHNSKHGAGDNQFGVRLGDIRKLAAKIKTNQLPTRRPFARNGWPLMIPGHPAQAGA
jgi:hypothetical protein